MIMETPLMFSRASSLDSVSTPPDHPDDRSSVISEFRLLLGLVYFAISVSACLSQPTNAVYNPVLMTYNQILSIHIKLDQLNSQFLQEKLVLKPPKALENSSWEPHKIVAAKWQNVFIQSNITKWLCLNSKKSVFLVGLQAKSFVFLYARDFLKSADVDFSFSSKVSVSGELIAGDTFRLWNSDLKSMSNNLLLVINTKSLYSLQWYQFLNAQATLHSAWSLPEPVHFVKVVRINLRWISVHGTQLEEKYIVRLFTLPSSISINLLALTLIQTLKIAGVCRDPLFIRIHRNSFIIVTSVTKSTIHVYSHSDANNEIYFNTCKRLHVAGLKYVSVFHADGFGFLIVVGDVSQVVKFTPCGHVVKFVMQDLAFESVISIAVPPWKTNHILIGKTSTSIKIAEWKLSNLTYIDNSLLSSGGNSAINLLRMMNFASCAVLHFYGNDVWFLFLTAMNSTLILHLSFSKSRQDNSVGSKLHKLISEMISLQSTVDTQLHDISKLRKWQKNILNTKGDIVTRAWFFDSISPQAISFKDAFSFLDIQVNDLKFHETQRMSFKLGDVLWKSIEFQLVEFTSLIQKFKHNLAVGNDWTYQQTSIVPRNFSGELKLTGFASFYRLTVTDRINSIGANEFFENIVRLDNLKKIPGPKVFTSLHVRNLLVSKILDVSAEHLFFDDNFVDLTGVSFDFEELKIFNDVVVKKSRFINQLQLENICHVNNQFSGLVHLESLAAESFFAKRLKVPLNTTTFKCLLNKTQTHSSQP